MGFEALDYISVHKKSFQSSFSKWKPKSRELHDLDAIRGSGPAGQWGALN